MLKKYGLEYGLRLDGNKIKERDKRMKEIIINCLVFLMFLCLHIIETFVIVYIVAFLLRFIHIYQIMGYNAKYFLFFVFFNY